MEDLLYYYKDFSFSFLSILLEGIPFILLGTLISGLIDAFLPSKLMTRLLPRNANLAILMSGALGIFFPMCECGIVPVIRRLIQKGLPVSCGVAYMLAAPIVNPVVAMSTFAAFRGQDPVFMTSMRMLIGYAVAVLVAFVVDRIPVKKILNSHILERTLSADRPVAGSGGRARLPGSVRFRDRLAVAVSVSCKDFLDVTMFLVIGAAITAVFNTAVDQSLVLPLATDPLIASASLMALAGILSLCSTSDAFIAATLVAFPAGAKLAFLTFGPMMDIKLLFLYSVVFRKKFVAGLGIGLYLLIWIICSRIDSIGL